MWYPEACTYKLLSNTLKQSSSCWMCNSSWSIHSFTGKNLCEKSFKAYLIFIHCVVNHREMVWHKQEDLRIQWLCSFNHMQYSQCLLVVDNRWKWIQYLLTVDIFYPTNSLWHLCLFILTKIHEFVKGKRSNELLNGISFIFNSIYIRKSIDHSTECQTHAYRSNENKAKHTTFMHQHSVV